MHAGFPYQQETIAIMHMYPQVYADLGCALLEQTAGGISRVLADPGACRIRKAPDVWIGPNGLARSDWNGDRGNPIGQLPDGRAEAGYLL